MRRFIPWLSVSPLLIAWLVAYALYVGTIIMDLQRIVVILTASFFIAYFAVRWCSSGPRHK